jgi:hypothetical protein
MSEFGYVLETDKKRAFKHRVEKLPKRPLPRRLNASSGLSMPSRLCA